METGAEVMEAVGAAAEDTLLGGGGGSARSVYQFIFEGLLK